MKTPEEIAAIMYREFVRQADGNTGYVGEYQLQLDDQTTLDGHFNLIAVANAVLAELKAPATGGVVPPLDRLPFFGE